MECREENKLLEMEKKGQDEDVTRRECYECGETTSCGLYNENKEWRCEDCCGEEEDEEDEVYREFRKEMAEDDYALINENDEKGVETEMKIKARHLRWILEEEDDVETSKIILKKIIEKYRNGS
jgi:hypothetical protein